MLLTYLAESSVSVMENTLVEKEQLASMIYAHTDTRPDILIWFNIYGVATEKLADVEKRFFDILRQTASHPLDMQYMKDCLNRYKRQIQFATENSADIFSEAVIEDHLYGARDGSDLKSSLVASHHFDTLAGWSEEQWREFLTKWLVDAHHVSILGQPSAELSGQLKKDEEARVKAQQEHYGDDGLKRLAEKLEQAKEENDKEVPKEFLERFKVPGTSSIHFISTTTARSGRAKDMGRLENPIQERIDADAGDLPLFIHFEHIPSNFVRFTLVMSTRDIPVSLKPLLALYLTNFFDTPIMRDGKRIEFEQVVTELEKDTISYTIDGGARVGNPELLRIAFQVETEKYQVAIEWLRNMLFNSIFDPAVCTHSFEVTEFH